MLEEIKRQIGQLAETKTALTADLDVSRRVTAEIGRERDELQEQVERLQVELERTRRAASVSEPRGELEKARMELARERLRSEDMKRELEAARTCATIVEARLEELTNELVEVENERDDLRAQLRESSTTMSEILRALELAGPAIAVGAPVRAPEKRRHLRSV